MFILVDKQTNKIIDTLQALEKDENYVRSSGGSLMQLNTLDIIEYYDTIPSTANYYKDGRFSSKHFDEVAKDEEEIRSNIDAIDRKSIRDAEDIYDLLVSKVLILEGEKPELPFVKLRVDEKKKLRLEIERLTGLE
jgi:hypothetical protein